MRISQFYKKIVNIPITITCHQDLSEQADIFISLVEKELQKPELNKKLEEVVNEAKINALNFINSLPPKNHLDF